MLLEFNLKNMNLLSVKDLVKAILTQFPKTRDNDKLLILKVWAYKKPELRNKAFTFVEFSQLWLADEFPPTESIRRVRQKMQEEYPHLRGEKYKDRHKHQESIKEELQSPEMKAGGTP